jgi:hypothetical protein
LRFMDHYLLQLCLWRCPSQHKYILPVLQFIANYL